MKSQVSPCSVSKHKTPPPSHAAVVAASTATETGRSTSLQQDIRQVERGLASEDHNVQLAAAMKLRHLLSSQRDILMRQVLEKDWIPQLMKWVRLKDRPKLQLEALWALTNVAAGATENIHVLLKNGVISTLVNLLDSPIDEVLEQSFWVLGNLAAESSATRDAVISAGVLSPLIKVLDAKSKLTILRIGTWSLSNLCDGQPRPVFEIGLFLPTLAKLLDRQDSEVLSHVCWALSHLCDGPSSHIQMVVNSDVCWRLVELLTHQTWRVTKPALRAIGNIVCAEDDHDYTQHIIECGAVPCLRTLIGNSNCEIQKEACWTLSNIAAGTIEQIQCVLDSGSVPSLIELASSESTDAEVKSEACWVVLNATSCGSDAQIEYLVKQGCIGVLGGLLEEASMVMMALEGLERILQVGELEAKRNNGSNPYARLMATTKFEALETHKSAAVSKRASRIWRQHFVTCAICSRAYSKHSSETEFCTECKCHVCEICDCSVFHLQYQESFWKEETEKETSEKQAKQASKRSKRQKKRQRTKERKAALLRQQKEAEEGKGNEQWDDSKSEENDHDDEDNDDDENGRENTGDPPDQVYPKETKEASTASVAEKTRPVSTGANDSSSPQRLLPGACPSLSPCGRVTDRNTTLEEVPKGEGKWMDKLVVENDNLVSYLQETGSILALALRLDEDDDGGLILEEHDQKLIHA